MLPDAPIVAWWPHEVPHDPSADPVGTMAGRRVTDTLECAHPQDSLRTLRAAYHEGDTDLAWTRLTVWRGLLAAALDQPPFEKVHRGSSPPRHPPVRDPPGRVALPGAALPRRARLDPDAQGVSSVRLERATGPVMVDRPDGRVALLHQPGQPDRHLAMPLRTLTECLAEELRRMDPDEVYGEVLTDGLSRIGVA